MRTRTILQIIKVIFLRLVREFEHAKDRLLEIYTFGVVSLVCFVLKTVLNRTDTRRMIVLNQSHVSTSDNNVNSCRISEPSRSLNESLYYSIDLTNAEYHEMICLVINATLFL